MDKPTADRALSEIDAMVAAATQGEWVAEGAGGIRMDGTRDGWRIGTDPWHGHFVANIHTPDRKTAAADAALIAKIHRLHDLAHQYKAMAEGAMKDAAGMTS